MPPLQRLFFSLLLLSGSCIFLTSCGLKGPLYLPQAKLSCPLS
ncbi:MAG: hypothetical protein EBY16_04660 [Gammaproteobacteria bacterium]|nr:hypothetical protein [Gammaproteobacteria bacterium]